jgi:hypothetical protein
MNKPQNTLRIYHSTPADRILRPMGWLAILTASLVSLPTPGVAAETGPKANYVFVNVADNTQGFSLFGFEPAINNSGAVAFEAAGPGFAFGSVWKWQEGILTLIATSAGDHLHNFGDNVVINASGRVGFNAIIPTSSDAIIATGDGGPLNLIAGANEDGLIGRFLAISALNDAGTAVFLGLRRPTLTQAIFVGNGGPLQTVVDAATDGFSALGNSDINASGKVVFAGFAPDGTESIWVRSGDNLSEILDGSDPSFAGFIDPVINDAGTVGIGAFLSSGGSEVLTTNGRTLTSRTNPAEQSFLSVDNVCINNSGAVAFTDETLFGEGIFVQHAGAVEPRVVLETGDPLFGSTIVSLSNGRFSLNDGADIVFHYGLADGRSGIGVAFRDDPTN